MDDKLNELFNKQIVLQERFKNIPFKSFQSQQEFININILAATDELYEALRETAWKNPDYIKSGWKKHQEFNQDNFQKELIDLWHFVINLTIASGMNAEQLYNNFLEKNKENHERQDKGY